jgi:hypothetical protein
MQGLQGDLPQAFQHFFETLTGSHAMQGSLVVIIAVAASLLFAFIRRDRGATLAMRAAGSALVSLVVVVVLAALWLAIFGSMRVNSRGLDLTDDEAKALEVIGYDRLKQEQAAARAEGPPETTPARLPPGSRECLRPRSSA